MKHELTEEQKEFRLDDFTLNREFTFWLTKAKCMWNLKETNKRYNELRLGLDHATALEVLKKKMFQMGLNL